ncbi:MAG TPA: 5-(carboxyamino)imidazole ribonucleotide mutase [Chthoniobacterales bacterium]
MASMKCLSGSDHRQDADATTGFAFYGNALQFRMADLPALVAVIMGSTSDWETMSGCVKTLDELGIPNEAHVFSAHRTPDKTVEFVRGAAERGIRVLIGAAGGAAHLAGVIAAHTWLPVLGVPMKSTLNGLDSLLSTVQMPGGIPVGTLAIGSAGAKNAALLAASILALSDEKIRQNLQKFRQTQTETVLSAKLPK